MMGQQSNDHDAGHMSDDSFKPFDGCTTANVVHEKTISLTDAINKFQENMLKPSPQLQFSFVKKLGQGGFGVVHLCESKCDKHKRTPEKFALKQLSSSRIYRPGRDRDIKDFLPLNEPSIQRFLKHRTIVETYWADVRCLDPKSKEPLNICAEQLTQDASEPLVSNTISWTPLQKLEQMDNWVKEYSSDVSGKPQLPEGVLLQMRIAMEYCDRGSLKDWLVPNGGKKKPISLLTSELGGKIDHLRCVLLTCLDIAEGLKFMHIVRILHGDLKPHNILLVSDKSDEKRFRAKVSDFGLSAHMTSGQDSIEVSHGTEAYLPLEVFETCQGTEASDIYALGLLMWEVYYGIFWHSAWAAEKRRRRVRHAIDMNAYRPGCTNSCPEEFSRIVHDCIRRDPSLRPKASEVVTRLNRAIESLCEPKHETTETQNSAEPPVGVDSFINKSPPNPSVRRAAVSAPLQSSVPVLRPRPQQDKRRDKNEDGLFKRMFECFVPRRGAAS